MVTGPATGGALLAHTIAGLLDSRRSLTHPPCSFAPIHYDASGYTLRPFYARELKGKRVLLADDVRNTGQTLARCAALVQEAGGSLLATIEIYDRLEADRRRRRQLRAGRIQGAGELQGRRLSALRRESADYEVLGVSDTGHSLVVTRVDYENDRYRPSPMSWRNDGRSASALRGVGPLHAVGAAPNAGDVRAPRRRGCADPEVSRTTTGSPSWRATTTACGPPEAVMQATNDA